MFVVYVEAGQERIYRMERGGYSFSVTDEAFLPFVSAPPNLPLEFTLHCYTNSFGGASNVVQPLTSEMDSCT